MIPLGGRPCHGVTLEGLEMLLILIQVAVPMWLNAYVKTQGAWSTAWCKPPASQPTSSTGMNSAQNTNCEVGQHLKQRPA